MRVAGEIRGCIGYWSGLVAQMIGVWGLLCDSCVVETRRGPMLVLVKSWESRHETKDAPLVNKISSIDIKHASSGIIPYIFVRSQFGSILAIVYKFTSITKFTCSI